MASKELACVYAALILNDDNLEITNDKIKTILNASGIQIESYWIELFAEYFKTHDITELIKGTSLGGSPSTSPTSANGTTQTTNEDNQEDKKEEEDEEMPGGFDDLFG